jgi:mannose-1-phosphate guanylyltransferase
MIKENNYGIIMAGGIGSRFWPMSTPQKPKQFLDILGLGKTLIQMTYERLCLISPKENIYILTNISYVDLILEQLPQLNRNQILTEPQRKNTAPCIAYAAKKIATLNKNAVLVIAPSDHLILKDNLFVENINTAINKANENELVTLGIKPTRPDTGYGYIEFDKSSDLNNVKMVKQFREKPNLELAKEFVSSGNFYWNSGIFIWKAETILNSLKEFSPNLYQLFTEKSDLYNTDDEQNYINTCFEKCEDVSIDYAIMEKAKNVSVVLATFDWSDLGTWGSLHNHIPLDENNNAVVGENVCMINSSNCLINLPNNKLAIIEGLNNHIIVESDNMLMILSKENEQDLKKYLPLAEAKSPKFFKL